MISKLKSVTMIGLECQAIDVEIAASKGLHSFQIVGLPDNIISESRERIKVSMRHSNLEFPKGKIVVNLAPSDLKKEGSSFDLPIAVGILKLKYKYSSDVLKDTLIVGELSLDGSLRHINGIISITEFAKKNGYKKIFVPYVNSSESALIEGIETYGFKTLSEVFLHLTGEKPIKPREVTDINYINEKSKDENILDMAYIKGQQMAKRALEISAAGSHNILMIGSPGSGKTLLGKAFRGILPHMTREEILEATRIYSIAGLLPKKTPLILKRPFRLVHHSASSASIIGGGRLAKPGEISLANRGAIMFDEFAEFPQSVLENLRQPMEDQTITVSRVAGTTTYPAQFILLATMNPCKCGYHNVPDSKKKCDCSPYEIIKYQKKISGPLLDRIDLYVNVPPVKTEELTKHKKYGESSIDIKKRVENARLSQVERFKGLQTTSNSEMGIKEIDKFCPLSSDCEEILQTAIQNLHLSARAYHRIIKVSRTIADLESSTKIDKLHILEALQYRKNEE